jgi:hypothetical protein
MVHVSGESRGELAEAIAVVGLVGACKATRSNVFWEERPSDALVLPDITIGETPLSPTHVVLVTACDTPRSSAMKYWRNLGELFDAKSSEKLPPRVVSLVFRSSIKEELIRLEGSLCDAVLLVDRAPRFGHSITSWLEEKHLKAPSKKDDKRALVERAITRGDETYDKDFAAAMALFGKELKIQLNISKSSLRPLWQLCHVDTQSRRSRRVREPRATLFRRGIARWIVLEDGVRDTFFEANARRRAILPSDAPKYAIALGMISKRLGGYALRPGEDSKDMLGTVGDDMRNGADFFLNAAHGDVKGATAGFRTSLSDVPEFMRTVAAQLRAIPDAVAAWQKFSQRNWERLTDAAGLYDLLIDCHNDESLSGRVKAGGTGRVWLYDHCIAMLRAATGRSNDFGYGPLGSLFQRDRNSKEFKSLHKRVLESLPPRERVAGKRWLSTALENSSEPGRRGFQDWLAKTKRVSPIVVAAYAYSLAKMLRSTIGASNSIETEHLIAAHTYSFWNKLLTYPDFDGLPGLVLAGCQGLTNWITVQTLMSEIAGETVQDAGALRMLGFQGGLVFWVSATDAGRTHKVKELCAKARCVRFQFANGQFSIRAQATLLFLVIDGTFTLEDLTALKNAGWDELFYPDEINLLANAIKALHV